MKKIAVFGAGGFGREVVFLIREINRVRPVWDFIGFFDDAPELKGQVVDGSPVWGGVEELKRISFPLAIAVAVGAPQAKRAIVDQINNPGISFPVLIHPGVIHGSDSMLGPGCIVCAGNILTVNTSIREFVTVNLNCTVGHDTTIGAFSAIMPGVCISGQVHIGKEVYIGTGANILNNIVIGDGAIVGAGALVNKSIPAWSTVVGVPARVIKTREPT